MEPPFPRVCWTRMSPSRSRILMALATVVWLFTPESSMIRSYPGKQRPWESAW